MEPTIGLRLSAFRKRAGMSLNEVARSAGYAGASSVQTYFDDHYDGPLKPQIAARLEKALIGKGDPAIRRNEVLALADFSFFAPQQEAGEAQLIKSSLFPKRHSDDIFADIRLQSEPIARTPVLHADLSEEIGIAADDAKHFSIETISIDYSKVIERIILPDHIDGDRTYVVHVAGVGMEPRLRPGEPLLIGQLRPLSPGDDVIVFFSDMGAEEVTAGQPHTRRGCIGTLVGRSSSEIQIEQYNPACRFGFGMNRVQAIHRIIPWYEAIKR